MWSLEAGFSTSLDREVWESFVDHSVSAGVSVSILVLALMYIFIHRALMRYSNIYPGLDQDQQLVTIHHVIELIVLSILFIPYTYLMLSLNFEHLELHEFRDRMRWAVIFMLVFIMTYAFELASRYRRPNPLLMLHHLAAYSNTLLPIFFLETAMMKAASVLTYFIIYEVVCFAGLVMYRLMPQSRATPHVIMTGIVVMGLSRPVQLLWIVSTLAASWEFLVLWQAILQLCLVLFFTVLQLYSLNIQFALWRRSKVKLRQSRDEHHLKNSVMKETNMKDPEEVQKTDTVDNVSPISIVTLDPQRFFGDVNKLKDRPMSMRLARARSTLY